MSRYPISPSTSTVANTIQGIASSTPVRVPLAPGSAVRFYCTSSTTLTFTEDGSNGLTNSGLYVAANAPEVFEIGNNNGVSIVGNGGYWCVTLLNDV